PRGFADAVALEMTPEREERHVRFARARARVKEREQELLVQPDVRIAVLPVAGSVHMELRATAVARVEPAGERRFPLLTVLQEEERRDEQVRVFAAPSV